METQLHPRALCVIIERLFSFDSIDAITLSSDVLPGHLSPHVLLPWPPPPRLAPLSVSRPAREHFITH